MANSETYPVVMIEPAPARYMGTVGSASGSIEVPGFSELGTGTATAHVLGAAPYFGARAVIALTGTATGGISIITNATGVTLSAGAERTVTLTPTAAGAVAYVDLFGVSTTRWFVMGASGAVLS